MRTTIYQNMGAIVKNLRRKFVKILLIVLATFTLLFSFGCNNSGGENTSNPANESWTVLIYMCGSNLESGSGEATKNLNEIMSADIPQNVNVVLQAGGASVWINSYISATNTDRYLVKNNALKLIYRDTQTSNFGESSTLTDFVSYGLQNYPADHTALILWDHGGGSLKGVCYDENFDFDYLTLAELNTALASANLSKKFDFIGFDACLMASYECANTVAPYANYMVASEEKEPSGGWNYVSLLTNLGKDDFYDTLLYSYAQKSGEKKYYTLSCFDLSGLDKLNEMVDALIAKMRQGGKRTMVNAVNSAVNFGLSGSGLFDLGNLFDYYNVSGEYSNYIKKVNSTTRSGATGLSIYFPLYDAEGLETYLTICQNESYKELLNYFAENDGQTIKFLNYASEEDNKLTFTLDSGSMANFAEAYYMLFELNYSDKIPVAYLMGNDNDVVITDNKVTISFEGRWVEIDGIFLYCTILDEFDGYTIYQVPVMVDDENAVLLFGYAKESKTTNIIGIMYENQEYGRINSLDEEDVVLIIKKQYGDDGYINVYQNENEFVYTGQTINVVSLPDGFYQYTAYVKDIYGTTYTAGTAVVEISDGVVTIVAVTDSEVYFPDID
jgi:hypothetical protein